MLKNFRNVFPIQVTKHSINKRAPNKYKVNGAKTERCFFEKDLKRIICSSSCTNKFYPSGSLVVKF